MAIKFRLLSLEKKQPGGNVAQVLATMAILPPEELPDYLQTVPTPLLRRVVSVVSGIPVVQLTTERLRELVQ